MIIRSIHILRNHREGQGVSKMLILDYGGGRWGWPYHEKPRTFLFQPPPLPQLLVIGERFQSRKYACPEFFAISQKEQPVCKLPTYCQLLTSFRISN